MIVNPMDILDQFPVRKTKAQKEIFRAAIRDYGEQLGYAVTEERGRFGACNVLLGNPETAKFLVTAHYDTAAKMPVPNFITPCNVSIYLGYQLILLLVLGAVAVFAGVAAGLLLGSWAVKWISLTAYFLLLALLVLGYANQSNANDNTSGLITLMEIAGTMPENQRDKVCFVLFDLEEAGLIGSACYRRKHRKASDQQLVLNLDCVGDGDHLMMFPSKKLREDKRRLASLYRACGYFGKKSLLVKESGSYIYPSDQKHFPYGVGICALRKWKKILYMSRIHTKKDTILDITNVNILRAALTTFICCDEVN